MRDWAGRRYWLLGADTPLGAALAHRLNARLLKRAFGLFLVLTAVRMAIKAFS